MYFKSKRQVETQARTGPQTPPARPQNASLAKTGQVAKPHGQKREASPIDPSPGNQPAGNQPAEQEPTIAMEGVYIISVAARILAMHPQTLRKYERLGLINPGRTMGMLRLYSRDDIRKLRLIRHLVNNLGMNLAGVEHTLGMVDSLLRMKQRLASYDKSQPQTGHMKEAVERELARVFQEMNLPVDD